MDLTQRFALLAGAMGIEPRTRVGPLVRCSMVELASRLNDDELRLVAHLLAAVTAAPRNGPPQGLDD